MNKKTLMVDMDDVIVTGNFLNVVETFLDKKIDINTVKSYYLQDLIPKEQKDAFWQYIKDKEFYKKASLLPDCYDVLEKLNKKYNIYIATAYIWKNDEAGIDLSGNLLKEKYYFLQEKLPFIKPEQYIFIINKNMLNFDIKIDDKPSNLDNANLKILFSAWHNKDLPLEEEKKYHRVENWQEIYELLK